jgi:hypothetical protein
VIFWKARRDLILRKLLDEFFSQSVAPSIVWPLDLPTGYSYGPRDLAREADHFGMSVWELAIAIQTGRARVVGQDEVGPILYLELLNTAEEAQQASEIPATGIPRFG